MGEEDIMILSGARGRVFGVLSLMHLQISVTKYLTSSYILGQKKCSFMSSRVRSYPKCPMSTCNSLNTSGFSLLGKSLGWLHHLFCEVSYHYSVPGWGVHAKAS